MASSIRFRGNMGGYRAFMNGSAVQGHVDGIAHDMADTASAALSPDWGDPAREDHFEVVEFTAPEFGVGARLVATNTEHAKRSQSKNKTLTKAFRATGG